MGNRKGRKRKAGAREKSGRLQRKRKAGLLDERARVARSQPHRRALKSKDRISELAESALGRLRLQRVAAERNVRSFDAAAAPGLTAAQHAAGEAFAAIVKKYRAVIEEPRGIKSLMPPVAPERADSEDQDASSRFACPSEAADPIERQVSLAGRQIKVRTWPCQLPGEVCMCAERRARYMRAYEAVAGAGRQALLAVIRIAVRGEEPAPGELVYLRRGLQAAAAHLGLTELDDEA